MPKLSSVVIVAVAFAAIGVQATSVDSPTPSKRVFRRQDDFVYHQVARAPKVGLEEVDKAAKTAKHAAEAGDALSSLKRSDVYERELFASDSEPQPQPQPQAQEPEQEKLSKTSVLGKATVAAVNGWHAAKTILRDVEDSALSTRSLGTEDNNSELQRRDVKRSLKHLLEFGAVGLAADAIIEDHKNDKNSTESSTMATTRRAADEDSMYLSRRYSDLEDLD
ncbi:hypothetical protein BT96DRAFT_923204 [Gymnopus androsaceus JB14]|uniref:Uncharacterized protein n=1 Tax=Gymnopus androsaceus JB14 TaxID=1447944 RepID=A0A6A4HD31_9AGAR|nr:hypothetical protein BT96DRAFT_923204 [Gymnopus androsaceus JB14]